ALGRRRRPVRDHYAVGHHPSDIFPAYGRPPDFQDEPAAPSLRAERLVRTASGDSLLAAGAGIRRFGSVGALSLPGGGGMKSHAQRPDVLIVAAVVLLLALGVVTVMSAASVTDLLQYNDPYYHVKRQLVWAVLGVIAMTVLARVDYRLLRALTLPALAGAFLLLVLVLFVGSAAGGARRWLGFGFISVQPSEVAKLALVMYTAAYVAQRRNDMHRFFSGLLPPLVITGAACLLILLEPDFGTAAMIALIVVVMLYAGGASPGQLLAVGVAAAPLAAYL